MNWDLHTGASSVYSRLGYLKAVNECLQSPDAEAGPSAMEFVRAGRKKQRADFLSKIPLGYGLNWLFPSANTKGQIGKSGQ